MKRSFFSVITLLFVAGAALAAPVTLTWSDHTTHWPGWGGAPGWVYAPQNENAIDAIGEPQITGGTIVINDGMLQRITFSYSNPPGWTGFSNPARPGQMLPGDLFLDMDENGAWDHVASLYNGNSNAYSNFSHYANTNDFSRVPIYSINLPLNGPAQDSANGFGYLVTGSDNQGWWAGYDIRNHHPFAVTGINPDVNPLLGFGSVIFANSSSNAPSLIFDVEDAGIATNGELAFGFAQNCANEAILYSAPEPSTALLLGSGLALATALLRRKKQTIGESNDRAKAKTATL